MIEIKFLPKIFALLMCLGAVPSIGEAVWALRYRFDWVEQKITQAGLPTSLFSHAAELQWAPAPGLWLGMGGGLASLSVDRSIQPEDPKASKRKENSMVLTASFLGQTKSWTPAALAIRGFSDWTHFNAVNSGFRYSGVSTITGIGLQFQPMSGVQLDLGPATQFSWGDLGSTPNTEERFRSEDIFRLYGGITLMDSKGEYFIRVSGDKGLPGLDGGRIWASESGFRFSIGRIGP